MCVCACARPRTFNGERLPHSEQFAVGVDRNLKVQQGLVHDERIQGRRICPSPPTTHNTTTVREANFFFLFFSFFKLIFSPPPRTFSPDLLAQSSHTPGTCAGAPIFRCCCHCTLSFVRGGGGEINCILIHCVNTYIITWTGSLCGGLIRNKTHRPSISDSGNIDPIDPN